MSACRRTAHRVPGPLDPVHRLPHRPHVPAVERELARVQDRLVAELERFSPAAAYAVRALLARAHHGRASSA